MKKNVLRKNIRIYPFRGYGLAFVNSERGGPISLLKNQFRKSRIYIYSEISRVRTLPGDEPDESTGCCKNERVNFRKTALGEFASSVEVANLLTQIPHTLPGLVCRIASWVA
jgi:hypothetical protein